MPDSIESCFEKTQPISTNIPVKIDRSGDFVFKGEKSERPALLPTERLNTNELFPNTENKEVLISARYPIYDATEQYLYSDHPFWYSFGYGEIINRALESRGEILSAPEGTTTLVHQSTADAERYQAYIRELLGYQPQLETHTDDFRKKFAELTRNRVAIVTAPYIPETINSDVHYSNDPNILARVNNKDFLDDFVPSEAMPDRISGIPLDPDNVLRSIEIMKMDYPLVLKGGGGGNSGGKAVRIVKNVNQVQAFLQEFAEIGCQNVTIEEYFSHTHNYGIQFVSSDEGVKFFGYSEQGISDDGRSHQGNYFDTDKVYDPYSLPFKVWSAGYKTACGLQKTGYRGPAEYDILYNEEFDEARLVDPNIRLTASTPTLAMIPRFLELTASKSKEMELIGTTLRCSIDDIIRNMGLRIERGEIFIMGAATQNDITKVYMTVVGDYQRRQLIQHELCKLST